MLPPVPRVAALGPTNVDKTARAAGVDPAAVHAAAHELGAEVARRGWSLLVVPDRGVAVSAMDAYLQHGGEHLVGICPSSGISESAGRAAIAQQRRRCHQVVDDLTWYEQHYRIGVLSDAMVAVGASCGTLAEVVWTKWNAQSPPLALVAGTSSGLPPEIAAEVDAAVVEPAGLGAWLDSVLDPALERQLSLS